jgi:hypothetical protein
MGNSLRQKVQAFDHLFPLGCQSVEFAVGQTVQDSGMVVTGPAGPVAPAPPVLPEHPKRIAPNIMTAGKIA